MPNSLINRIISSKSSMSSRLFPLPAAILMEIPAYMKKMKTNVKQVLIAKKAVSNDLFNVNMMPSKNNSPILRRDLFVLREGGGLGRKKKRALSPLLSEGAHCFLDLPQVALTSFAVQKQKSVRSNKGLSSKVKSFPCLFSRNSQ